MEKFKILSKNYLEQLPKTAGVYLFYSKKEIIYIGKAINIKDRVKNHFQQPSYRDNLFISKVSKIGFIETNSEIEALILEANLIKKYQPKFNVVWRDDKNYFYVAIAKNKDKIPYVYITHQPKLQTTNYKLQTNYVGPFVEGNALKKTLKFLRKIFPYYTSAKHPKNKCTWCYLDLCPGPNPDMKLYSKNVKKLILILRGKRKNVLSSLKREMSRYARSGVARKNSSYNRDFENATKIRNRIYALEQVMAHTHVITSNQDLPTRPGLVDKWHKTQKVLQNILRTEKLISRIECYDVSNIQGKNATGSMVVFVNGMLEKSQYKKFSIRVADTSDSNIRMHTNDTDKRKKRLYELVEDKPNDIAMLEQVLTRRFNHPEWDYPEVMLIDGGIAQLNVAIKTKHSKQKTKNIRVISIAKGRQELFIEGKRKPIPLKNLPQDLYNLIKHLDDEAHRFAIAYHKKLRKKALGIDRTL